MRINPIVYGVLVLVVFVGIILGFRAVGIWSVSGKISSSGDQVQPVADDVDTIKGWMTLEQISATYNVPVVDILGQFELPADTLSSTAIKDLETDLFSVTNLRTWLEGRVQAAEAPQNAGAAAVPFQQTASTSTVPAMATSVPAEHVATDKTVTGRTTFQDLLDWGVPQEAIQKVIGGDIPAASVVVKDFITEKGMEFPTIKAQLQAEVEKITPN
jgi:hypothetical protein